MAKKYTMPKPEFRCKNKRNYILVPQGCVRFKNAEDYTPQSYLTFAANFNNEFSQYKFVSIYESDDNVCFWFCNEEGGLPLMPNRGSLVTKSSRVVTIMLNDYFDCPNYYRDVALIKVSKQPKTGSLYYAPKDKVTLF